MNVFPDRCKFLHYRDILNFFGRAAGRLSGKSVTRRSPDLSCVLVQVRFELAKAH